MPPQPAFVALTPVYRCQRDKKVLAAGGIG